MNSNIKKRVVSGIQPTGVLHLGNYIGAITNFLKLQNDISKNCFFFIADNHSATTNLINKSENSENIDNINKLTIKTAACLLACGINPKQITMFNQSKIPAHSELMWILSCMTPLSWLNKMIQFKDKNQNTALTSVGLYTYPILMSADILIYKGEEVPVGEDQIQHIELARDIAVRTNKVCKKNILPLPEYLLNKESARIMSLQNGKKKMSKSDVNSHSCISLITTEEEISNKIIKAKTDSIGNISYDTDKRPEVSNLVTIYSQIENIPIIETVNKFKDATTYEFKIELIKSLHNVIMPISYKAKILIEKEFDYVRDVLDEGRKVATIESNKTLEEIKYYLNYL